MPTYGKRPIYGPWLLNTSATTDPDTIRRYWSEHPTANIAMATGEASGIIVVDLDVRPARNIDGIAAWNRPIDTLASTSARGGLHLFYRWRREIGTRLDPARGIDIWSHRGSVTLPPSTVHGARYEWINDLPIAEFPTCT